MHIRKASLKDSKDIVRLYKAVAEIEGGLIRTSEEITLNYVQSFVTNSIDNGIILVIENPEDKNELIAEMHASKPGIKVLNHILFNLSIVVHPDWQGKGVGRKIFSHFLEMVSSMPTITRVELIARESNTKAIQFYQSLGFKIEGKFENRIRTLSGALVSDVPMAWTR